MLFRSLSKRFLNEYKNLRDKTKYDYERWLRVDINPVIGGLVADDITEDDVQAIVDKIDKTRSTTARRCGELISSVFGWSLKEKIRDKTLGNPAHGIDLPAQKSVDNALRKPQLKMLWQAIDEVDVKLNGVVNHYALDIIKVAQIGRASCRERV